MAVWWKCRDDETVPFSNVTSPPETYGQTVIRLSMRGCPLPLKTKDELVQRIYKYFDEINEIPVVYHWKWKLDDIDSNEEVVFETLLNSVCSINSN